MEKTLIGLTAAKSDEKCRSADYCLPGFSAEEKKLTKDVLGTFDSVLRSTALRSHVGCGHSTWEQTVERMSCVWFKLMDTEGPY